MYSRLCRNTAERLCVARTGGGPCDPTGAGLGDTGRHTHCKKSFFIMLCSVRCRAGSWSSEDGERSQR